MPKLRSHNPTLGEASLRNTCLLSALAKGAVTYGSEELSGEYLTTKGVFLMHHSINPFEVLAARTQKNDSAAGVQLERKLAPEMLHIVRRVLERGHCRTDLDRRIIAAARESGWTGVFASREERESLVRKVAIRICSSVVRHLRRNVDRSSDDTVRPLESRRLF